MPSLTLFTSEGHPSGILPVSLTFLLSGFEGRNLPYSCWMDLCSHDCTLSGEVVQILVPPTHTSPQRWVLATRSYPSGVVFDSTETGLVSVTRDLPFSMTYCELGQEKYFCPETEEEDRAVVKLYRANDPSTRQVFLPSSWSCE
jgi:hypothetical protein